MGTPLSCPDHWASPGPLGATWGPVGDPPAKADSEFTPYWSEVAAFCGEQWPVAAANAMDWFHLYAYTSVEPWITEVFFGGSHTAAWIGFGVSFIIGPVGSLAFGMVADTFGRRPAVLLSLSLMCVATVGQGLVPVVPHLGPSLLLTCRVLQGIAAGGETSLLLFLTEKAPTRVLGMSGVFLTVGDQLGVASGSLVTVLLSSALTNDQMLQWGWRVPFLLALLPAGLALYFVSGIEETAQFQEVAAGNTDAEDNSVVSLWEYWPQCLLSTAGAAAALTQFDVTSGPYFREWLVRWLGMTQGQAYKMLFLGQIAVFVPLLPVGVLADTYGLGKGFALCGILMATLSTPIYYTLLKHPTSTPVLIVVGIMLPALLQASTGPDIVWMSGLFPPEVRGRCVAVTYNIANVVGGLGPMVCSLSTDPLFPGYYCTVFGILSATACITSVWLHRRYLRTRKGLRTAYLLEDPF